MESTLSLELTFFELRWVASAFGLARLPLSVPDIPTESLLMGRERLRERGLIEAGPAGGWQLDPFLALAVQWMGGAVRYWVCNLYRPKSQPAEFGLFLEVGAPALLVSPLADGKRVTVCRDVEAAITEWQLAVGLSDSPEVADLPDWAVPQPITVIRTAWTHPQFAKTMAAAEFLSWAAELDWAGEWALIKDENRLARLALAVQGNSVWAGSYVAGRPGEFPLKAYRSSLLRELLLESQ